MKIVLLAATALPTYAQFAGDADDYDSLEYGDDEVESSDLQRKGVGKIPGSRVGGRKRMINSMAIRNFWEFEQYGCWCIEKKGYGPVRDEIDFACMAHTKCWGCARAEHENCDGLVTPYRWKFIKDTATNGPVDIKCLDSDPCKRSICECDRRLAINLRNMESVYDENNRDQSKKHEQCPKKEPSIEMRSQVKVPHEKLDSCCGDEIFKFPFPSNGGKRACCGTRTFNTELLECCDAETSDVKNIGSCPFLN